MQNTPVQTKEPEQRPSFSPTPLTFELEKQIISEMEAGNNEAECLEVYNKWKTVLTENPPLRNKIIKIGKERKEKPRVPGLQAVLTPGTGGLVEPIIDEDKKITSDDLI